MSALTADPTNRVLAPSPDARVNAPRRSRPAGVGRAQRTFGYDVDTIAAVGRTLVTRAAQAAVERVNAVMADFRRGRITRTDAIDAARRARQAVQAQSEAVVRRLAEALHDGAASVLDAGGTRTDLARLGTAARRSIGRVTAEATRQVAVLDRSLDALCGQVAC